MAIPTSNITENWAAFTILTEAHLSTAMDYIDTQFNTYTRMNFEQFGLDVFGVTYEFDNDGLANEATPLIDRVALLEEDSVFTGANTFEGATTFEEVVTGQSTFSSSGQMRARVYRVTSNQSIPDVTATALSFAAETYDIGTMHDNSTNPSRLTIPTGGGGIYHVHAQVTFVANSTGRRELWIYKNGTEIAEAKVFAPHATEQTTLQVSCHDTAAAGDYYEAYCYQSSTGALEAVLGERVTFFSAMKVW